MVVWLREIYFLTAPPCPARVLLYIILANHDINIFTQQQQTIHPDLRKKFSVPLHHYHS